MNSFAFGLSSDFLCVAAEEEESAAEDTGVTVDTPPPPLEGGRAPDTGGGIVVDAPPPLAVVGTGAGREDAVGVSRPSKGTGADWGTVPPDWALLLSAAVASLGLMLTVGGVLEAAGELPLLAGW